MHVSLIPVLEIGYANQGVEVPDKWPCWAHGAIWDQYRKESHHKAGFQQPLIPFQSGLPLYELAAIAEDNLAKLMKDHTEDLRKGEYDRTQASAFFCGYILQIDGKSTFYPQCCGDLSDIIYWEKLSDGILSGYNGHPGPAVEINGRFVQFDFSVGKYDEAFQPPPPESLVIVEMQSLKKAVMKAAIELEAFGKRLITINIQESLNIDRPDQLLIRADNVHD